ncbi:MAG: peptide chain release factor N(5)-glutamine methyltransferase [Phycisphaeraceae bacterium]|nr:peptide chain release factor N(5)-glutamine methyltransferase [Phycisphaeraceae bacterium]
MKHSAQQSEPWTTRRLLAWMSDAFTKKGLDSPRLMAELLMAHVLGCERLKLYMEADRPATELERNTLRELVGRALKHEPIQYLVGEGWFFGLPFHVDRRVLVPRPATETIVQHVLQHVRAEPGFGGPKGEGVLIADVCTGSGCIAVAILKNLSGARVVGTDVSRDALEVARLNAKRHGVLERLDLLEGSLLEPLHEYPGTRGKGSLHFLVANPPYIPDHEWDAVEPNVKDHEPGLALRGGKDGLDLVRPLIEGGPEMVRRGGLIMIETAASTAKEAAELLKKRGEVEGVEVLNDFEGLPRVVMGRRV